MQGRLFQTVAQQTLDGPWISVGAWRPCKYQFFFMQSAGKKYLKENICFLAKRHGMANKSLKNEKATGIFVTILGRLDRV